MAERPEGSHPPVEQIKVTEEKEFPIDPKFEDITPEQVLETVHDSWHQIMRKIRKERDAIKVADEFVSFQLPVTGYPGRLNSLISLSTGGCIDAHAGDCTFCDYGGSSLKRKEVIDSLPGQVDKAFELIEQEHEGQEFCIINLTAIGSMFDKTEIPDEIRQDVYRRIAQFVKSHDFPAGAAWTTESRLRHVTRERLEEMRDIFAEEGIVVGKDLKVSIGYGIESTEPLVLEGAMGKRTKVAYKDAVELMAEFGVEATAHTLFKPPFLTERESIDDTVKTVRFAEENDLYETMIVMTMNVRDATLIGELHEQGLYDLPSIWSVAEIMKQLGPETCKKCHFFGFSVGSEESNTVKPKDEDERQLMIKILSFSGAPEELTEIEAFVNASKSPHKNAWQKQMDFTPEHSLASRIATGVDIVGKKYLGQGFEELQDVAKKKQRLRRLSREGRKVLDETSE